LSFSPSTSMSSPGISFEKPSPLKHLHWVGHKQCTGYQHTTTFEDYENLKEASNEDAVRF
jgi:hypothetical protein